MAQDLTVTGVILAGGRASRMGGGDKGLMPLRDRALIEYVLQALAPQVEHILINANRNQDRYRRYGFPVISDRHADYLGPLAGIASALQETRSDCLLSVPCDGPWLPTDLRERLQSALLRADAEIACVSDGMRMHPVYALVRGDLQEPLATYLEQGGRAVHRWFASRRLVQVDFSDRPELFVNINTAEQLEEAASRLRKQTG